MLSYAQNGEDVVLSRAFADQKFGFYVDIGACHPVEDSITLHFYERGWNGVNVEPDHELHAAFLQSRTRDINLCSAIGRERGRIAFYPTGTRGHGTLDAALASDRSTGRPAERVPMILLSDIIDCHGPDGEIDFLKIDVEGWEAEVIASGDWARHRPRLLVIEAVDDKGHPTHKAWEPTLLGTGYSFALFDGLNRFYCRDEDAGLLLPRLGAPANVRDNWMRARDEQAHATAARLQVEHDFAVCQIAEAEDRCIALGADLEEVHASEQAVRRHLETATIEVERLRTELAAAVMRNDALGADLEEVHASEQAVRRHLETATIEVERLRTELAAAVTRNDALAVDAGRARAEAATALRREEAAEARMAVLEMDLVRREADDAALRAALKHTEDAMLQAQDAAAQVAALHTSTSWRVTRPLRAISLLLRGHRGP